MSLSAYGQVDNFSKIVNSEFPNSWDTNGSLRNGIKRVLIWEHIRRGSYFERKSCIFLLIGSDSTGKTNYFISEMYTNEKPFNKWNLSFIYYADYFKDSTTGMTFGYRDLHLEIYDHKPSENELYNLLRNWEYTFFKKGERTIEAGLDEKLWLDTFGFKPDREKLSATKVL